MARKSFEFRSREASCHPHYNLKASNDRLRQALNVVW